MPTSLFLKKEMVASSEKAVVYNLEREFSGTRKNRGYKTYLSLAAFGVILLAGTFGATSYIEHRNTNIPITIADFEDINMQELLYSLRNAGKLLADMRNSMEAYKGKMGLEMQRIRMESLNDLEQLKLRHNLTDAQRAAMMRKILEERDRRLAATNAEHLARLRDKERAIEDMKNRMGDYEVQLQRRTEAYVGKLETKLKEYQSESKETKASAEMLVRQASENYLLKHREEQKEYEKKLKELSERIKKTEDSLKGARGRNDELEYLLALYRRSLMHYAFMKGEQGHVVCVEKSGSLLVVLNPLVDPGRSCRGMVVDKNGALIARIEITPGEGMTSARVLKKLGPTAISPFDMIIVQKE
jgi:hypothetical protein